MTRLATTQHEATVIRLVDHGNPDHYVSWLDDLEVLSTVAETDIDAIYDKLNGKS